MPWIDFVGPFAFMCAVVLLPGLLVTLAAGLRGFLAIGLAPMMSVMCVAAGAVVAGALGIAWSIAAPLATAVTLAAVAWFCHRWLAPRVTATWRGAPALTPTPRRSSLAALLGTGIGAAFLARHVKNVLDRPDAISQTFDNIFHLPLIRYIVQTSNGSSMSVASMTSGSQAPGFYPAAFHDLASLALQWFPTSVPVASNAALAAIVIVIWPLSCMTLVALLTDRPWTLVATGVLAASFTAFPILLMGFGVLYPNLLGLALLPAAVGLVAQALSESPVQRISPCGALALGVPTMVALFLAHPNVVVSLFAISIPIICSRMIRLIAGIRRAPEAGGWLALTALLASLTLIVIAWSLMRPIEAIWKPPLSQTDAVGQALLNAHLGALPAWSVSALMLVGIAVAYRRRLLWLPAAWLVAAFLWLVVASYPVGEFRDALTGTWYNDPYRLAALLPTAALPLAAFGFGTLLDVLDRRITRPSSAPAVSIGLAVVLLAGLTAMTQRVPYMDAAVDRASRTYAMDAQSPLLTLDEYRLIMRLPSHVAPADTIAVNPWNGSSMAYALTGLMTTTTHIFTEATPDTIVVDDHLDEAATNPAVCPALSRLKVKYALDFGDTEVHGGHHERRGFEDLATAPGFTIEDAEGAAVLYRVTACG